MAIMHVTERGVVSAEFQRALSDLRERLPGMTKHDVLAAVAAADQWASDNAASFNSALPAAARTNLTASQKARLLTAVIEKRWKVGV